METHFFLGANSSKGFISLYDGFTDPKEDRLYIIKGFPGTGKSGFMRKIGASLAAAGADVEYIHCSGDPDSLDGIYLPQLHTGYVDGTVPHVIEPRIPGGCETYVNLSPFCNISSLEGRREEISALLAAYRGEYAKAYECLASVSAVRKALSPDVSTAAADRARLRGRAAAMRRIKEAGRPGVPSSKRRFLTAVTCKGTVTYFNTVSAMADSVTVLDNKFGLAPHFISAAAEVFRGSGFSVISLLSPEGTDAAEHLIVPELRIAYISASGNADLPFPASRRIHLDAMADGGKSKAYLSLIRQRERLAAPLSDAATERLASAKALHDELEAFYTPLMDFRGVDALASSHAELLLKKWTNGKNGV